MSTMEAGIFIKCEPEDGDDDSEEEEGEMLPLPTEYLRSEMVVEDCALELGIPEEPKKAQARKRTCSVNDEADESKQTVSDNEESDVSNGSSNGSHSRKAKLQDCILSCPSCPCTWSKMESLKRHMDFSCGERKFSCLLCDYKSTAKGNAKTHMVIHNQDRRYTCPECPYTSRTEQSLKRHMTAHVGMGKTTRGS